MDEFQTILSARFAKSPTEQELATFFMMANKERLDRSKKPPHRDDILRVIQKRKQLNRERRRNYQILVDQGYAQPLDQKMIHVSTGNDDGDEDGTGSPALNPNMMEEPMAGGEDGAMAPNDEYEVPMDQLALTQQPQPMSGYEQEYEAQEPEDLARETYEAEHELQYDEDVEAGPGEYDEAMNSQDMEAYNEQQGYTDDYLEPGEEENTEANTQLAVIPEETWGNGEENTYAASNAGETMSQASWGNWRPQQQPPPRNSWRAAGAGAGIGAGMRAGLGKQRHQFGWGQPQYVQEDNQPDYLADDQGSSMRDEEVVDDTDRFGDGERRDIAKGIREMEQEEDEARRLFKKKTLARLRSRYHMNHKSFLVSDCRDLHEHQKIEYPSPAHPPNEDMSMEQLRQIRDHMLLVHETQIGEDVVLKSLGGFAMFAEGFASYLPERLRLDGFSEAHNEDIVLQRYRTDARIYYRRHLAGGILSNPVVRMGYSFLSSIYKYKKDGRIVEGQEIKNKKVSVVAQVKDWFKAQGEDMGDDDDDEAGTAEESKGPSQDYASNDDGNSEAPSDSEDEDDEDIMPPSMPGGNVTTHADPYNDPEVAFEPEGSTSPGASVSKQASFRKTKQTKIASQNAYSEYHYQAIRDEMTESMNVFQESIAGLGNMMKEQMTTMHGSMQGIEDTNRSIQAQTQKNSMELKRFGGSMTSMEESNAYIKEDLQNIRNAVSQLQNRVSAVEQAGTPPPVAQNSAPVAAPVEPDTIDIEEPDMDDIEHYRQTTQHSQQSKAAPKAAASQRRPLFEQPSTKRAQNKAATGNLLREEENLSQFMQSQAVSEPSVAQSIPSLSSFGGEDEGEDNAAFPNEGPKNTRASPHFVDVPQPTSSPPPAPSITEVVQSRYVQHPMTVGEDTASTASQRKVPGVQAPAAVPEVSEEDDEDSDDDDAGMADYLSSYNIRPTGGTASSKKTNLTMTPAMQRRAANQARTRSLRSSHYANSITSQHSGSRTRTPPGRNVDYDNDDFEPVEEDTPKPGGSVLSNFSRHTTPVTSFSMDV